MISNTAGLGIVLMTVTGYAMFMSHIGASTKLALKATKPLRNLIHLILYLQSSLL